MSECRDNKEACSHLPLSICSWHFLSQREQAHIPEPPTESKKWHNPRYSCLLTMAHGPQPCTDPIFLGKVEATRVAKGSWNKNLSVPLLPDQAPAAKETVNGYGVLHVSIMYVQSKAVVCFHPPLCWSPGSVIAQRQQQPHMEPQHAIMPPPPQTWSATADAAPCVPATSPLQMPGRPNDTCLTSRPTYIQGAEEPQHIATKIEDIRRDI